MQIEDFKKDYKYGFTTEVESDTLPKGLDEKVIETISLKNGEPPFILDFRKKAFKKWKKMKEPHFANVSYPPIDYQDISYYSRPRKMPKDLKELDPEIMKTMERLGIPLEERQKLLGVATDVVFDSVSLGTTLKDRLLEMGVVLCSIREAIQTYPALVEKYLGSVVPYDDNFFAALNSAVFSDGSFVFVPKGVKCPIELSTYFRINQKGIGQFERTLIIAEEESSLSYLEGCTAPKNDKNQLHAAVVELIALDEAEIKYSTVQNWYPGDPVTGLGGIYNFVTKRGLCKGRKSKISWTQVEAGAAISWKYPGTILEGDYSSSEFYSVALTNGFMQTDTGTRMIHIGRGTTSTIMAKSIATEKSKNSYRGLVKVNPTASGAKNWSQCESLLVGDLCSAHTFPTLDVKNDSAKVEHEASTSKLSEEELFYLRSRGLTKEDSANMIVNGFCRDIIKRMPLEFAVESERLLAIKLEGAIG